MTANCTECKQPLIEMDNRGQHLRGCLACNAWQDNHGNLVRLSQEIWRSCRKWTTRNRNSMETPGNFLNTSGCLFHVVGVRRGNSTTWRGRLGAICRKSRRLSPGLYKVSSICGKLPSFRPSTPKQDPSNTRRSARKDLRPIPFTSGGMDSHRDRFTSRHWCDSSRSMLARARADPQHCRRRECSRAGGRRAWRQRQRDTKTEG